MIVLQRNPFEPHIREIIDGPVSLASLLRPGETAVVTVDGVRFDGDTLPKDRDVRVVVIPEGSDFLRLVLFATLSFAIPGLPLFGVPAASLGGVLIRTGYWLIGAALVNALLPIRGAPPALPGGSPSYQFDGVQNTARWGIAVPAIYGSHRVGGNVIALRVDGAGTAQLLHMLIALGEGVIDQVSDLLLDDQPASTPGTAITGTLSNQSAGTNFDGTGLEIAARLGTRNQASIRSDDIDFDDDTQQVNYTDGVSPGEKLAVVQGTISGSDNITGAVVKDGGAQFVTDGVNAGDTFHMGNASGPQYSENKPLVAAVVERVSSTSIRLRAGYGQWFGRRFMYDGRGGGLFGRYEVLVWNLQTHTVTTYDGDLDPATDSNDGYLITDTGANFPASLIPAYGFVIFRLYPDPARSGGAGATDTTIASVDSETQVTLNSTAFAGRRGEYQILQPLVKQVTALAEYTKAFATFLLPRGRAQIKGGRTREAITRIRCEYRAIGAGTWLDFPDQTGSAGTALSNGVVAFTGDTFDAWSETFRAHTTSGLTADQYEFRFTRLTPVPSGTENQGATEVRLSHIVVANEATRAYARTALLAIRSLSTASIHGRFPASSVLVQGRHVYDPRNSDITSTGTVTSIVDNGDGTSTLTATGSQFQTDGVAANDYVVIGGVRSDVSSVTSETVLVLADVDAVGKTGTFAIYRLFYTDNPALIARDIVLAALDPSGWADVLTPSQSRIDDTSFSAWADWCEGTFTYGGGSVTRCRCDIVLDETMSLHEALRTVSAVGRASIIQVGTQFQAVIDKAETESALMSSADSLGGFSAEYLPLAERAETIEVSFLDRDNDFKRTLLYVPDQASAYLSKPTSIDAKGITRALEAERFGKAYLYHNQTETKVVSISTGPQGLALIAGDVIRVQHSSNRVGWSGRIVSYSATGGYFLTLDQEVTLVDGTPYEIRIRQPDDTLVTRTVLNVGTNITLIEIDGAVDMTGGLARDAVYVLGEVGSNSALYRVIGVERTEDAHHRLACVPYDATIYTKIEDDTQDSGSTAVGDAAAAQHVQNIRLEQVSNPDEGEDVRINVLWQPAAPTYYGAEVYVKVGGGTIERFGRTTGQYKAIMPRARVGDRLDVYVVALKQNGQPLSLADAPSSAIIVGSISDDVTVPDVTNLSGARDARTVRLTWDAVDHPLLRDYEIRLGTWAGEVLGHTTAPTFSFDNPAAGTYCVKARDVYGNESAQPTCVTIPAQTGLTAHIDYSAEPTWPDTKTGCAVNSEGGLEASATRGYGTDDNTADFTYELAELDAGSSVTALVNVLLGIASRDMGLTVAAMTEPTANYTLANGWTVLGWSVGTRVIVYVDSSNSTGFTPSYQRLVQGGVYSGQYWRFKVEVYGKANHRAILTSLRALVQS